MAEEIINRVEKSGLISLDLEEILGEISMVTYDLSQHLYQGLILREKEFRKAIKEEQWDKYTDANVLITCSADAIIPLWAYMLVMTKLEGIAKSMVIGSETDLYVKLVDDILAAMDVDQYQDAKVVIKGCSDKKIQLYAYGALMNKLLPVASSIMCGEPCSTVPLFKRRK